MTASFSTCDTNRMSVSDDADHHRGVYAITIMIVNANITIMIMSGSYSFHYYRF